MEVEGLLSLAVFIAAFALASLAAQSWRELGILAALATQPIDPVVTAPERRRAFRVIEGGKE